MLLAEILFSPAISSYADISIIPRRSSTRTRGTDENVLAKSVIDSIIEETESEDWNEEKPEKNPAAVALGRLGGKKGGKARAAKLSPEQRSEIAKKAAQSRWKIEANYTNRFIIR